MRTELQSSVRWLRDGQAAASVTVAIERLADGNTSNVKSIGPRGGVHRVRELNSSSNCDGFGTVSKCGASDGIVSQDALDPVYRCAPISRVSASSSKPAGTQ